MKFLASSLLLYLSLLLDDLTVSAIRIPFTGHRVPHGRTWTGLERLGRRASMTGSTLSDSSDIEYYTNITLGGQSFKVLIDTGR